MDTPPRIVIVRVGYEMNYEDRGGNRRSHARSTGHRYARKHNPPSYHGLPFRRTLRFTSPNLWRDRRFGSRFL